MITPGTVVGDIIALFALGVGADEGTVDVQDGFLEKLGWLLGPDSQPRLIDSVHQFERHRRYQSAKTRELLRTLDTLCKLRKAGFGMGDGAEEMAYGKCQMEIGR